MLKAAPSLYDKHLAQVAPKKDTQAKAIVARIKSKLKVKK
jgi:hypothetical protein